VYHIALMVVTNQPARMESHKYNIRMKRRSSNAHSRQENMMGDREDFVFLMHPLERHQSSKPGSQQGDDIIRQLVIVEEIHLGRIVAIGQEVHVGTVKGRLE
jgi:hypothetical protein